MFIANRERGGVGFTVHGAVCPRIPAKRADKNKPLRWEGDGEVLCVLSFHGAVVVVVDEEVLG